MRRNQTSGITELACLLINNDLLDVIPHFQPSNSLEFLSSKLPSILFPHNSIPVLSSNRIGQCARFYLCTQDLPVMPFLRTLELTCCGEPKHGIQHCTDIRKATAHTGIPPKAAIAYDSIA